ncbi:MAG: PhoU domain-containing protein [Bacteroidota bacterium]|jgi:phosphate uptake regulator
MLEEIPKMVDITKMMLKEALDSFILLDTSKAHPVLEIDDQINNLNRLVARRIIELVRSTTLRQSNVD